LFLALSRTPHGLLDLAVPALAALLCLGQFPPAGLVIVGLLTVFAGYTSVYALNDLVDYRIDREKLRQEDPEQKAGYLDAVLVRHPLAQGLLSPKEGLVWAGSWALIALLGAYLLNPVCAVIFVSGCLLEAVYCGLLRVSHLRLYISGVVKSLGGIAAVFAVTPQPSWGFLLLLFAWIFSWEIGGQNVPADWHDVEADQALGAKTIPVTWGLPGASRLALASLTISVALGVGLLAFSPLPLGALTLVLGLGAGVYFLLLPAYALYCTRVRSQASRLFNRASYYPLALLLIVLLRLLS
jgi:4-hydroxybenzoate polyprenyltransferase